MQNRKVLMHQQYKMENNELKKVLIKNRTCSYFGDINKLEASDLDNVLIDEKLHINILIFDISCKTLIGSGPLQIRFDKIDGFIKICDGLKCLVLLDPENYDAICNKIRYFISLKSSIKYIFFIILQNSKLIFMILYL